MDTIFAVSSGAPPAAIAVLRISGTRAFAAAEALTGALPQSRRAALRPVRDSDGVLLDRAVVLLFPGPDSSTGEDVAELHLHGGRAVVRAVEAALAVIPGLRPAEPGEFTRRALANGRIDLTEAEALGDLLMAETETQHRAAIRNMEGGLRRQVEGWTTEVLGLAAQVEALLDHDDEGDVASLAHPLPVLAREAGALAMRIAAATAGPTVERLRDGVRVVLAGPPNAGKSTLFNYLAEREAAIVSPIAGTTRDRIEAPVARGGIAWLLIDTAGLAEATDDVIERIGIERARNALAEADLVLWLGDDAPPQHPRLIPIHARCDQRGRGYSGDRLAVSAATGEGIAELWDRMTLLAREILPPPDSIAINRRQRDLLETVTTALRDAEREADALLFAEHLRTARAALDRITGRADVEAMLDTLFARFCIGK